MFTNLIDFAFTESKAFQALSDVNDFGDYRDS
jgi:hypothetical protein